MSRNKMNNYKDENIWTTQKAMATLFDCDRSVITKHLGNIFGSGELKEEAVCAKFAHTASDGKNYQTQFYSLDAIIAVVTKKTKEEPDLFGTFRKTQYICREIA